MSGSRSRALSRRANDTLEDDVSVLEQDGWTGRVKPFTRDEMLKPLERWFFGR